jgi:hypothetical protein
MFQYNHGRCAAKVKWQLQEGAEFKQCTRKPKQGNNLCGIHALKNPHGLVPGAEAPATPTVAGESEPEDVSPPSDVETEQAEEGSSAHAMEDGSQLPDIDSDEAQGEIDGSQLDASFAEDGKPPPAKRAKIVKQKYMFNFKHISDHMDLSQQSRKSEDQLHQLEKYSSFCVQVPDDSVPNNFKELVDTMAGPISLQEGMVKLYLTNLRFAGGLPSNKVPATGHVQQLAKVWHNLLNGIKQSDIPHTSWPAWVNGTAAAITQLFRAWKRADSAHEPAVLKRTWISSSQVEDYCIKVILEDMQGLSCYIDIGEALLMRLQSARSHRFVNLAELKWADTGSKASATNQESIPLFNIMCTKPLGTKTIQGLVHAKCKVELLITDAITKYLWDKWSNQPCPECVN